MKFSEKQIKELHKKMRQEQKRIKLKNQNGKTKEVTLRKEQ